MFVFIHKCICGRNVQSVTKLGSFRVHSLEAQQPMLVEAGWNFSPWCFWSWRMEDNNMCLADWNIYLSTLLKLHKIFFEKLPFALVNPYFILLCRAVIYCLNPCFTITFWQTASFPFQVVSYDLICTVPCILIGFYSRQQLSPVPTTRVSWRPTLKQPGF